MKMKIPPRFTLGFGAGMFIAALLFYFLNPATDGQSSSSTLSDSSVQAYLQSIQKVSLTQKELDQKLSDAHNQGVLDGKSQTNVQIEGKNSPVWVYIPSGMSLTEIANLLMAAGVCDDGNALIKTAENQSTLIHSGVLKFQAHSSIDHIVSILTSKTP